MNNPALMAADTEARRRIREDIGTNFFVEAGAGSGKTTALVDRMVALVEGGVPVEKICAITFTVAASREFFARFRKEMNSRLSDEKLSLSETVKERIRTALENIDLCFMGTIDSFCNQLLGEYPILAGVPSALALTDDSAKPGIYRREYARLKRKEYGEEITALFREFCSVQKDPDNAFLKVIPRFMAAHAANWIMPDLPVDWRNTFAPRLDELLAVLEIISGCPDNLATGNANNRAAKDALPEALRILRNYRNGISFWEVLNVLEKLSAPDDPKSRNGLALLCEPSSVGIESESLFSARGTRPPVYCLNLNNSGGLLDRLREYQYAVSVRFLAAAAKRFAESLKARGELSFYDYLLYLRNMLRRDAASGGQLVRHVRSHYAYFLIDEFQDTDPNQAEVFFRLASDLPVADWRNARPVPGSLFIVGDPKQSIYRFRGADVGSYLSVKQLFVPPVGEVLSLQCNFRSSVSMRNWFNDTFAVLLPEETAYQSKYEEIPIEEGSDEPGVLTGAWNYETTNNSNATDVAGIIRRLVNNPDILIHTRQDRKDNLPPRMVNYRDIMVITRTTVFLEDCLLAMKDAGIPCRVNGRTAFTESRAFVAMADFLSAFANPSDSAAVYRVLRGEPFRFTRKEITEWKQSGHKLYMYGHDEEDGDISEALHRLNDFRNRHVMLSPAALCPAVLDEFGLLRFCGTEDMEYVWHAVELLRYGTDKQGSKSLTDAAMMLRNLAIGKNRLSSLLNLNQDSDRVFMANLHRVKGLEAPIVILAQPSSNNKDADIHMEPDGTEQKRWALRLTSPDSGLEHNKVYGSTNLYKDIRDLEVANLLAEEMRLVYVAATRAGCALLIPRVEKCIWSPLLTADTGNLAEILPPLPDEADEPAAYGFEQDPGRRAELVEENPLLRTETAEESWKLDKPSEKPDSDYEKDTVPESDPEAILPRGETSSTALGTAVHRAMEMLVSSKGLLGDEIIIRTILAGNDPADGEKAEEISSILRNTLKTVRNGGWPQETGVSADILTELLSADEVYCEVPFCVTTGGSLINGVMDVVYRKGEAWHVVDYKTNAEPYGLDVVYQEQLAAYRNAMRQLFGAVADVHTYHIPLLK